MFGPLVDLWPEKATFRLISTPSHQRTWTERWIIQKTPQIQTQFFFFFTLKPKVPVFSPWTDNIDDKIFSVCEGGEVWLLFIICYSWIIIYWSETWGILECLCCLYADDAVFWARSLKHVCKQTHSAVYGLIQGGGGGWRRGVLANTSCSTRLSGH